MSRSAHRRHDISDAVWKKLEPLLPGREGSWGGVAHDNRRFIDAVFWIMRTGAPWRDLPPDFGGWSNTHVLEAENVLARRYFAPGMHRSPPYSSEFPQYLDALPVTDALCKRVMQLPSGEIVSLEVIQKICELIRFIQHHAQEIRERL